jgi:hypothetical protein
MTFSPGDVSVLGCANQRGGEDDSFSLGSAHQGCKYLIAERDSHSQRLSISTVNDKLKNV